MTKKKLLNLLNKDLANLHIFWVKLHNYHWHVVGHEFFTLHEKTESYYTYVGKLFDDVAERILQLGGKPFASAKEYLDEATIEESEKKHFSAEDVLTGARAGFETLKESGKAIVEAAEELDDVATANLYEDHVQEVGKYIWMLTQASSKASPKA
jgi:starvation-inducible DNA-binding protein